MKELILPKTYEDPFGNYPQHRLKPKLSYSQIGSWKDPLYKLDYIRQYFMGQRQEPGIYAQFGSACGQYFEDLTIDEDWLSDDDVQVLRKLERPENARYEVEIVIDRGWYVIQGFIDQETEVQPKLLDLIDLKTGNVDTKKRFYAGPDYQQTTIYCHQRVIEGFGINYSGVKLLGRKGNGENHGPLRLSGVIENIPTPYSTQRAENALAQFDIYAIEISNAYQLYLKLNK